MSTRSHSPRPAGRLARIALLLPFLAAALPGPSPVLAQTVQGIVEDGSTHQPVGGARLSLISDSAFAVAQTVADSATGMFYLSAPAPGHYRVQIVVGRGGLVESPAFQLDSNQVIEQPFAVPPLPPAMRDAYLREDVTQPARLKPDGDAVPRYPDRLRREHISGIMRGLVVVDSMGLPDMTTFRVVESSHPDFVDAVRSVLPHWRFTPAELNGHRVAQVKEISADFGFNADPSRLRPVGDEKDGIVIRALGEMREP